MDTSTRILRAAIQAAGAAAFFFLFQFYVLNQPAGASLVFALALGAGAAGLSWSQTGRHPSR
jgi:hypothetical protein